MKDYFIIISLFFLFSLVNPISINRFKSKNLSYSKKNNLKQSNGNPREDFGLWISHQMKKFKLNRIVDTEKANQIFNELKENLNNENNLNMILQNISSLSNDGTMEEIIKKAIQELDHERCKNILQNMIITYDPKKLSEFLVDILANIDSDRSNEFLHNLLLGTEDEKSNQIYKGLLDVTVEKTGKKIEELWSNVKENIFYFS